MVLKHVDNTVIGSALKGKLPTISSPHRQWKKDFFEGGLCSIKFDLLSKP